MINGFDVRWVRAEPIQTCFLPEVLLRPLSFSKETVMKTLALLFTATALLAGCVVAPYGGGYHGDSSYYGGHGQRGHHGRHGYDD